MQSHSRILQALDNVAKNGKVLPEIDEKEFGETIVEGERARQDTDSVEFTRLGYNNAADIVYAIYDDKRIGNLGLSYNPDDIDISDFPDNDAQ